MISRFNAQGLCLFRGERCLFTNLDVALASGELLLVRGDNGSGKTSLLRGICGLLEFESGELAWDDTPIRGAMQTFRSRFAWFGHAHGFKAELTPEENLEFEATLRPGSGLSVDDALERVGLTGQRQLPFRALSAGQQKRAALARLLLASVPMWVMDEPYTNLDARGRALIDELVGEHLDADGMALVATHHDMLPGRQPRTLEIPVR